MGMEIVLVIILQLLSFFLLYFLLRKNIVKNYGGEAQIQKINQEVSRIIVELNNITDRNIGLIESKIIELKEIMTNTDKRILLMKREEEKHDLSKKVYTNILEKSKNEINVKERNLKDEVIKLYRNGLESNAIANQLGASLGEVELIISLSENK